MKKKCLALLSGGLDSKLAIKIMQAQGIEVEALSFKTQFNCCKDEAGQAARELGVQVTQLTTDEEYLKMIEKPVYGYGRGVNPCTDCRIHMFSLAAKFMDKVGASFMVSGEVVGQRPNSQLKRQLSIIDRDTQLEGLLVRPLSAKLLPPTKPEIEGILDREKMYGISGRSRKELIQLAHEFGITNIPSPSTGCLLTEEDFGVRVKDMFQHQEKYDRWDFDILKFGRHFRFSEDTKAVLGKSLDQNLKLEALHEPGRSMFFRPENFYGPGALLSGNCTEEAKAWVTQLILHYSKNDRLAKDELPNIEYFVNKEAEYVQVKADPLFNAEDFAFETRAFKKEKIEEK